MVASRRGPCERPRCASRIWDNRLTEWTIDLVAAFAILLALTPLVSAQTVLVTTDTTWRVTAVDPGPGTEWRDSVLFDDSSWGNALFYSQESLDGDAADTIWIDGPQCGDGASPDSWFRKEFTLGAVPNHAFLSFGVDDDADVYLNGNLVEDDHDFTASLFTGIDVAAYLVAGENLLAVHAADSAGGCRGFVLRLAGSESCGSGSVDAGEQCDDGNLSNADCCSADCQGAVGDPCAPDGDPCTVDVCNAAGGCGAPPSGCKTANKSLLAIKRPSDPAKHKLTWTWTQGEATSPTDFGTPTDATEHILCLQSANASAYLSIPPGAGWEGGPKGFKYKVTSSPHGVQKALLKSGSDGKAKVLVKGKGADLPDSLVPELTLPVAARVINNSNGTCFEAVYVEADVIKNDETQFKAKKQSTP
jgi:cysteine-rich repeat protein